MKTRSGSLLAGAALLAGALLLVPSSASAQNVLTFSSSGSASIPDPPIGSAPGNPAAPAEVTVEVNEGGPVDIQKIEVEASITHSWIGDLKIEVEFNGTTVVLMDRPGREFMWNGDAPTRTYGSGHINVSGFFTSDGSGTDLETTAAVTGNGVSTATDPHAPLEDLSQFHGMDANGTWTVRVIDHNPYDGSGTSTATLNSATLRITCECPPIIDVPDSTQGPVTIMGS